MTSLLQNFFTALAFLSRLSPARHLSAEKLSHAVVWYPAAGAVIGFLAASPVLFVLCTTHTPNPWVFAWLYVLLQLWLTRGLHWDGVADICDALGCGVGGEKFWTVLKDSRLGAFGGMALVMGLGGQIILAAACIESSHAAALVWAPVFGRAMTIPLARMCSPNSNSTLAALVHEGMKKPAAALCVPLTLATGVAFLPLGPLAVAFVLGGAGILFLAAIARANNGYNGDFLGAVIIWGELSVLLAVALLG